MISQAREIVGTEAFPALVLKRATSAKAEEREGVMETKRKVNPQYKDRLFRLLFGSNEMRGNIISLYNALYDSTYTEDDIAEITTLDDAVYIKMKNDVSLLIDSYLTLWEQQSSYNPNMPLRGLMYFGNLYAAFIDKNRKNIYGRSLIKIPTPQYIVFYNGTDDKPSVQKLQLSDAFEHPVDDKEFEWTATVYNLNKGKNDKLLSMCKPLSDYMTLVNYIRDDQSEGMSIEEAVDTAVKRCIAENVLGDFLQKHRAEVMDVCLTEYNEEVFVNGIREEGLEEGLKKGRDEGRDEERTNTIMRLLDIGKSTDEIFELLNYPKSDIEKIAFARSQNT
jgi:hypothetical protein